MVRFYYCHNILHIQRLKFFNLRSNWISSIWKICSIVINMCPQARIIASLHQENFQIIHSNSKFQCTFDTFHLINIVKIKLVRNVRYAINNTFPQNQQFLESIRLPMTTFSYEKYRFFYVYETHHSNFFCYKFNFLLIFLFFFCNHKKQVTN